MDKTERVLALLRVGPLRDWATTDERLDEIAAILRREYAHEHWMALKEFTDAARREALEEAASKMDRMGASAAEDGDKVAASVFEEAAAAIRAAEEET